MGLLDGLNDPMAMGLLGAGAALLQPRRVGFGDAINAFQGSAVETQNRVALQKRNEQQTQLLMMQLAQMKEAQEREKQRRTMAQQFNQTPGAQAASLPGGPSPQNAAQIPNMPGGFDANGYMQALLGAGDLEGAGQAARFVQKPADLVKVGADESLVDPITKKAVFTGKAKQSEFERMLGSIYPPGSPEYARALQNWVTKQTTHQPQVNVSYGAPMAAVNPATGKVELVRPDNKGGMAFTGIKPAPTDRDIRPTDGQSNAALYASRMEEADKIIKDVEGKYNRSVLAARQAAGQGVVGMAANSVVSSEAQKADQAQRNFINAVLRRESGAVIADQEFANARIQYFPQPGDTIEVVKQKERNRQTAIDGIKSAGAPAFAARENGAEKKGDSAANDLRKKYGLPPL
jgi:hypothetical protein